MLFTCYYLVSVPRYNGFSKDEMIDIIHTYENKPASEYTNFDMAGLQEKLLECINKDIRVVLKCQEKMAVPIKRNGKDDKKKNGKIEADDFYKKIQRLVDNKNRLNSHMSTVSDPIASEREITDTIMNLEEFLDYLTAAWEYEMKYELLEKYRKELAAAKEEAYNDAVEAAAIDLAVENAEIVDLPEEMIHEEVHRSINEFLGNMQRQGISPEMYFQITGTTQEDLHKQYEAEAESRTKTNLVVEAVAKAEGFEATEEEINAEIEQLAADYNMPVEQVRNLLSPEMLKHDITVKKAVNVITSTAKVK